MEEIPQATSLYAVSRGETYKIIGWRKRDGYASWQPFGVKLNTSVESRATVLNGPVKFFEDIEAAGIFG